MDEAEKKIAIEKVVRQVLGLPRAAESLVWMNRRDVIRKEARHLNVRINVADLKAALNRHSELLAENEALKEMFKDVFQIEFIDVGEIHLSGGEGGTDLFRARVAGKWLMDGDKFRYFTSPLGAYRALKRQEIEL